MMRYAMIKLFNIRRTLQRMEKYDFMKKSNYYKTQKQLLKRYANATSKEDKQYAKELIQKEYENAGYAKNVRSQLSHAKEVMNAVNETLGEGEKITIDNINKFFDFANKIQSTMQDVFYDSNEIIVRQFQERVLNKKMSVDNAIEQMRKEGIIL